MDVSTEASLTTLATTSTTSLDNSSLTPSLPPLTHDSAFYVGRAVRVSFLLVNAAVALVGNSLSLAVFTRSRHLGRAPSSGYLAALAVADTGSAVMSALGITLAIYNPLSTVLFCNVIFFLNLAFQFLSVWLVVCFTTERYVSVCHPLRAKDILARFRERKVVFVLVVVATGLYSPHLVTAKRMELYSPAEVWQCFWVDDSITLDYGVPFLYVTFALHFAVPMTTIVVLNLLIVCRLCRPAGQLGTQSGGERGARNRHITVMLLLVCLAFFLCHLPFNIVFLLLWAEVAVNEWLYQATQMLLKVSYSSNFFLYALSGSQFRSSLKALFSSSGSDGGGGGGGPSVYVMSARNPGLSSAQRR